MSDNSNNGTKGGNQLIAKHPIIANIIIIIIIAIIGIYAVYLVIALFTKHGQSDTVPAVENMSYTQAINILHDEGFRVDIRDSVYRDDVRPGYVVEQFPKPNSVVKPGRKIFLYINSVHPKEVVIDDDNHPTEYALKGVSSRSAQAKLEELGFKHVRIRMVLGSSDRVVKVTANGKPVYKTQKIPVNANMVLEIADGRLDALKDSLQTLEYLEYSREERSSGGESDYLDESEQGNHAAESEESGDYDPDAFN